MEIGSIQRFCVVGSHLRAHERSKVCPCIEGGEVCIGMFCL